MDIQDDIKVEIIKLKLSDVKPNPDNPRIIKDDEFKDLVKSLKDFPEMTQIREVVIDEDNIILGGNMRFKAMQEAGWKEAIFKRVNLPRNKAQEFIIKDNVNKGEWDWDRLANEWNAEELEAWGLELPLQKDEEYYSRNISAPTYEIVNDKPDLIDLVDDTKTEELRKEILNSSVDENVKNFLILASQRHLIFDYSKIADYYANSDKEVQELMEKSALVIIDFKSALENNYVELTKAIADMQEEEYE